MTKHTRQLILASITVVAIVGGGLVVSKQPVKAGETHDTPRAEATNYEFRTEHFDMAQFGGPMRRYVVTIKDKVTGKEYIGVEGFGVVAK